MRQHVDSSHSLEIDDQNEVPKIKKQMSLKILRQSKDAEQEEERQSQLKMKDHKNQNSANKLNFSINNGPISPDDIEVQNLSSLKNGNQSRQNLASDVNYEQEENNNLSFCGKLRQKWKNRQQEIEEIQKQEDIMNS